MERIKLLIVSAFSILSLSTNAQSTQLYFEDFTGEDEKGIQFSGTDVSGVTWSVDTNGTSLTANGDHIKVERRNGEDAVEARDLDGYGVWNSPIVDVSGGGYHYYFLSVDLSEIGNIDNTDTLFVDYQVNQDGIWLPFDVNSQLTEDFTSATATSVIASGSVNNIQIRVTAFVNAGNERYRWDNVEIRGLALGDADSLENFNVTSCIGQIDVTWSLPSTYVADSMTVLVFAKETSAITVGTPTNDPASYTASTTFGSGTAYQNDGSAFCIYNGDGTSVTPTSLTNGSSYHFVAFIVHKSPNTGYSTEVTGSGNASATMVPVQSLSLTPSSTSMTASWTAPDFCYDGFLVAVNTSTVTGTPSGSYTVNSTDFTDATNPTLSDGAVLVFNGTATTVTITGLTSSGTTYFVEVFAYSSTTYSTGVESSVNTAFSPTIGDLLISEVSDQSSGSSSYSYLEILNLTGNSLDISTCKLVETSSGSPTSDVFDFDTDGDGDLSVPGNGMLTISRNIDESSFESNYSITFDNTQAFLDGNNNAAVRFTNESNGWILRCGGTANTNDGDLMDQTNGNKSQRRAWQFPRGNWNTVNSSATSTPGQILSYEDPSVVADLAFDGTDWRGGTPGAGTASDRAIVANGSASLSSDVSFDSLEVYNGTSLTVESNSTLTIAKDIVNDGTITVKSGSSLLQTQTADNNTGAGSYSIERSTGTLVDDTRFQYWGSPVSNATMGGVFTGSNSVDFYYFDESTQAWTSQGSGSTMTPGRGYATTGTIGGSNFSETRTFGGTANNGNISITTSSVASSDAILVSNPYPSAISSSTFVSDNSGINGTLYFWDHATAESGGSNDASDYATWNGTGSAGSGGVAPDDYIQSCQGFFVEASSANPTISFNNNQRASSNNTQFFKQGQDQRKRVWLSVSNDSNDMNQLLVGYLPQATLGVDRLYDGHKFKGNNRMSFYSILEEEAYAIQGLPDVSLEQTSIVPLGLDAWLTGGYTIHLDSTDNWPQAYTIHLEDRLQGTMMNLQTANTYSFALDSVGEITDRFYLHVKHKLLAVDEQPIGGGNEGPGSEGGDITGIADADITFANVYRSGEALVIEAGDEDLEQVSIHDLSGRLCYEQAISGSITTIPWNKTGVFVVSIKTATNSTRRTKVSF